MDHYKNLYSQDVIGYAEHTLDSISAARLTFSTVPRYNTGKPPKKRM